MDQNTRTVIEKRIERTIKALENNNGRAIDDMSVLVVKIFTC